ncbi:class I SAM-dependent methyltransferase [Mesorhizobium sp. RCC_202]|uniref:rhamnosyltransferase WsaF family glycosyltransferase n=1 Tax=Mesorhizobium sp. RCC_202 TaxID=3239222 RepID=UPI0035268E34
MLLQPLNQLYDDHHGKVSDKWSLYLSEYDRIFSRYRNAPVRLLEIGVQNGGSLEVWSRYFPQATLILGCDANPECKKLKFDDRRIKIVIGDAGSDETSRKIAKVSGQFDIIIDDGSHRSDDIIRNFSKYFPLLAEGGTYIAEDLHCSYWQEYGGGLFQPLSSLSFFKRLVDVVNHEHWGTDFSAVQALVPFADNSGTAFDDALLPSIHEVRFLNSLCIVTRKSAGENELGKRRVVGGTAPVAGDMMALDATVNVVTDQTDNPYSWPQAVSDEEAVVNRQAIVRQAARLETLSKENEALGAALSAAHLSIEQRDVAAAAFRDRTTALESQVSLLQTDRDAANFEASRLNGVLSAVYASTSWRATGPMRSIVHAARAVRGRAGDRKETQKVPESPMALRRRTETGLGMMQQQRFSALAAKAYHYWRVAGTAALLQRVAEYRRIQAASQRTIAASKPDTSAVASLLESRFRSLAPISFFNTDADARRITVITDSISRGSLFGGVGTSLILAAAAAQKLQARLRVVTRTEPADTAALKPLLAVSGVTFDGRTEFQFLPPETPDQLPVHELDRFITTSWWTTAAATRLPRRSIFYLLQEDERMFYPAGDDLLRCDALLRDQDLPLIVNSKLLFDHLALGIEDLPNRASYFEPAFPEKHFFQQKNRPGVKRTLLFYARPNNPRNLFYLGCEVLQRAVDQGLLRPNEWRIVLCGKDIPRISFSLPIEVNFEENLRWDEYAAIVRGSDLGLSLMLTPHPSYPPLDLAASGAVVVTNSSGLKTDLAGYSRNIIVAEPEVGRLVEALRSAIQLVADEERRKANYKANKIQRDWNLVLEPVIERIARSYP